VDAGYTTHTCSVCGDSYKDSKVAATGEHTYENGVCTGCGAAEPVELFDIEFTRMVLGNALDMQFAFSATHAADWTGAYAVATKVFADGRNNVTQEIPVSEWESTSINGTPYYFFTFTDISGKEMCDNVYVTIFNSNNKAISNEYIESVSSYVLRVLDNQNSKTKTMLVDMLNYGSAAQTFYSYGTSVLANSGLTDAQKAYATSSLNACSDRRVKGNKYMGSRLELKNSINLQIAFTGLTTDMTAEISFKNHKGIVITERVHPIVSDDNMIVVDIDQIVVADARQDVSVTVYNTDGTVYGSATDSIESYVARMTRSAVLYEMIMKFSDSAYAYLH